VWKLKFSIDKQWYLCSVYTLITSCHQNSSALLLVPCLKSISEQMRASYQGNGRRWGLPRRPRKKYIVQYQLLREVRWTRASIFQALYLKLSTQTQHALVTWHANEKRGEAPLGLQAYSSTVSSSFQMRLAGLAQRWPTQANRTRMAFAASQESKASLCRRRLRVCSNHSRSVRLVEAVLAITRTQSKNRGGK